MGKLVHTLLEQYRKDPEGVEAALNSHINNVVSSYTQGARAAGMEFAIHLFENYEFDKAMELLKQSYANWSKLAKTRRKK